jgi:hypothetical protein
MPLSPPLSITSQCRQGRDKGIDKGIDKGDDEGSVDVLSFPMRTERRETA